MTDVLLLVALRTDQPDIRRRIELILAAAQPIDAQTAPCAWAKAVDDLTAGDFDALTGLFDPSDIERLNVGSVSGVDELEPRDTAIARAEKLATGEATLDDAEPDDTDVSLPIPPPTVDGNLITRELGGKTR